MGLGTRLDEDELAVFGLHDQAVADEERLAVTVTTALPAPLARGGVETHQHAIVQSVHEAVVERPGW